MADSPPPPPPPAATTITALGDDILREIFLRLPAVTSLARVAFTCRAFLRAVRSSPAFRRRFRELHAPPLLALFVPSDVCAIVPAAAGKGSDIAAAFAGLLQDSDASGWRSNHYYDWYASFINQATHQCASYSPHLQALNIFPKNVRDRDSFLEFHTLSPDGEEKPPSRVVCVHRERAWAWARVDFFSSDTMEWQVVLPDMEWQVVLPWSDRHATGMVVNGFVCWVHHGAGCILALNTATFQFSRMYLPPLWKVPSSMYQLGHTKDGKFCVVNVLQCMLSVWLWAADGDGVGRFMLHKTFSLRANVSEITECSEEADVRMRPMVVINGFVYLSLITDYYGDPPSPEWFLSFCLGTAEVNLLHKESHPIWCSVDPYIMVSWPSSLIHGKVSLCLCL
jgi:hypothetical protein